MTWSIFPGCTIYPGTVLTVSPFYHFNRAHYVGDFVGQPNPDDNSRGRWGSNYFGGVASVAVNGGKHNFRAGFQVFGARDNQLFGVVTSDGSNPPLSSARWCGECGSAVFRRPV